MKVTTVGISGSFTLKAETSSTLYSKSTVIQDNKAPKKESEYIAKRSMEATNVN